MTAQDVADRTNHYLATLRTAEAAAERLDTARAWRHGGSMRARQAVQHAEREMTLAAQATEDMLVELVEWQWDTVAEPVLADLGFDRTPAEGAEWPRMWWCPTGPLTLLPLHAAGYHTTPGAASPQAVIDRVAPSYTSTLRALLEARKPLDERLWASDRLLTVGVADAPGQRHLSGVAGELASLAERIPAERRTDLIGERATRTEVRNQLPKHRWAHFSCHGSQYPKDPSRGGLVLFDDTLTIADVAAGQYHAEFAGLSACKTATGGINLLDEAITLAAALHYTGYRHVIGTLWSVYDSDQTTRLFDSLYREIADGGRLLAENSAMALHRATRTLRDLHPTEPSVWTPFTHTGP
jgi:CHAT domain-containing protein